MLVTKARERPVQPGSVEQRLEEHQREIRALQRDLYGDPRTRQESIFDRLTGLEASADELRRAYDAEKVEAGKLAAIQEEQGKLRADYAALATQFAVTLVYLKGIAGGVGTIFVAVMVAAVVGAIRYFAGG